MACCAAARLLACCVELRHPLRNRHGWGIGTLSARLRHIGRVDQSLGQNVPQFVMYLATKMDGFLTKSDAGAVGCKMPLENRKPDAREPMHLPIRINDQLQRDIV